MKTEDVRNALAFLLVGSFILILPMFIFWGMPATSKDIVTYMVGQLSGMALMALGFYFAQKAGQDALDQSRSDNTGKAFDAIKAASTVPKKVKIDNGPSEAVPVKESGDVDSN